MKMKIMGKGKNEVWDKGTKGKKSINFLRFSMQKNEHNNVTTSFFTLYIQYMLFISITKQKV